MTDCETSLTPIQELTSIHKTLNRYEKRLSTASLSGEFSAGKASLMKAAYSLAECRAALLKAVFAEIEAAEKQETEA